MANVIHDDGHRRVERIGGKTVGGAYARYRVVDYSGNRLDADIAFQHDTIKIVGVVGITNECLAAILVDRLECFQAGEFPCAENEVALAGARACLGALLQRTRDRQQRGVEGEHTA